MNEKFFENNFSLIREASSEEQRNEIMKRMVVDFTMHVLSKMKYDDYVIPNYVFKNLNDFSVEYYDYYDFFEPTKRVVFVNAYFKYFTISFEEKSLLHDKERELIQKIKKTVNINIEVLRDSETSDMEQEIKNNFLHNKPDKIIDVIVVNHDDPFSDDEGYDIYVRDPKCSYLIHKYLCYDDDVFKAVHETNRSIDEFLSKFEHEYNTSFFL